MKSRPGVLADLARGFRGLAAVAATYVFFLLWAQFGFLDVLQARLGSTGAVRTAMGVMGVSGLAASLLAGRLLAAPFARRLLPAGLAACAIAAPAALVARGPLALSLAAAWVGVATAFVTVPLAAGLRQLLPGRRFGLGVGLGTGVAYLLCNLPPLFAGTPAVQAGFVAAVCAAAALLVATGRRPITPPADAPPLLPRRAFRRAGLVAVVLAFLALIWLDSAAFAIIQETAALKASTWQGASRTLTQGGVHLLAAVAASAAIDAGRLALLPPAAFVLFVVAFPVISGGGPAALVAGPLYAVGISLYSVALVAYPASRGDEPGLVPRRWRAAWLYGVAGWLGSALGVGMAQDLHRIPAAFLVAAGAALAVGAWVGRRGDGTPGLGRTALRVYALPLVFAVAGFAVAGLSGPAAAPAASGAGDASSALARGRQVYVDEGCVQCHSQYVRPHGRDAELWGPARPLDRDQRPPLVGNRRQGPDLSEVGNRRNAEWQRLHLVDPRSLVPGSRMPSYAYLFEPGDGRGADLVAYLGSLGTSAADLADRGRLLAAWPRRPLPAGDAHRGSRLFSTYCSPCHGAGGRGDGPLADAVRRPNMDLTTGIYPLVSWGPDAEPLDVELARLVRFGAPGSPMPGHEWLSPQQVADLVAWLHVLAKDGEPGA